jgi:hypothetical protein
MRLWEAGAVVIGGTIVYLIAVEPEVFGDQDDDLNPFKVGLKLFGGVAGNLLA